jgi:hypothetical protein
MTLGDTLRVFKDSVNHPRFPHATVALRGRFMGETGAKYMVRFEEPSLVAAAFDRSDAGAQDDDGKAVGSKGKDPRFGSPPARLVT